MTGTRYRITRLENWRQFTLDPVMEALEWWQPPSDPSWRELVLAVESQKAAVWVGGTDKIQGLLIIYLPITALFPLPFVAHFEVKPDAPRGLKQDLVQVGVDFMRDRGYNRFWAFNTSGAPDSVWARSFKRAGNVVSQATAMVFNMELDRGPEKAIRRERKQADLDTGGHDTSGASSAAEAVRGHSEKRVRERRGTKLRGTARRAHNGRGASDAASTPAKRNGAAGADRGHDRGAVSARTGGRKSVSRRGNSSGAKADA